MSFLFLVSGYPILAFTTAGHDDLLFFRGLESILRGEWLGAYNQMTLAKGPFLSILGAFSAGIGIEAKFLEAMLYAAAAVTVAVCSRRFGLCGTLVVVLVVLLLSNPLYLERRGAQVLFGKSYILQQR